MCILYIHVHVTCILYVHVHVHVQNIHMCHTRVFVKLREWYCLLSTHKLTIAKCIVLQAIRIFLHARLQFQLRTLHARVEKYVWLARLLNAGAYLSTAGVEEDDPDLIGTGQEHRSSREEEQEQTQDYICMRVREK